MRDFVIGGESKMGCRVRKTGLESSGDLLLKKLPHIPVIWGI